MYTLTDKANFPTSDIEAARNIAIAQSIILLVLDKVVKAVSDNEEALVLWNTAAGLNSAAEIYYEQNAD